MKKILPIGYYSRDENNPNIVRLLIGPYAGLKLHINGNIKIRSSDLTSAPQLCYNYRVLDYAQFDELEIEKSKSLSRIIAAIVVEFISEDILAGGTIESVKWQKPESNPSS